MPEAFPRLGSAAIVRDGEGRVLLGRRAKTPYRGRWVLPGGAVRPFESLGEAACREVLEEAGLDVYVGSRAGVYEIVRRGREHRVIVFHWAWPVGGELRGGGDLETPRFFEASEMAALALTPLARRVLADVGFHCGAGAPGAERPARIDDDRLLNHWYDDRELFVVEWDPEAVGVRLDPGQAEFRLRGAEPEPGQGPWLRPGARELARLVRLAGAAGRRPGGNVARCWYARGLADAGAACRELAGLRRAEANAMRSEYDDPSALHAQADLLSELEAALRAWARRGKER